ncbi:hypothetical protein AAAC51_07010 [Priestia megaterium]
MSKEEVKQNIAPVYTVEEEDEEETMTIDFQNNKVYSTEENVILVKDGKEIGRGTSIPAGFSIGSSLETSPYPIILHRPHRQTTHYLKLFNLRIMNKLKCLNLLLKMSYKMYY